MLVKKRNEGFTTLEIRGGNERQAKNHKFLMGFTLIELLVVIAIIGLLATIVAVSVNSARAKARDAKRKADLNNLVLAAQMRYDSTNDYPASAGWFTNPGHGGLDAALTPTYMPRVPDDPLNSGSNIYMYWRKDFRGYSCLTSGTTEQLAFYTRLENPSANDQATIVDSFDICVRNTWGMNYKLGN